MRIFIDSPLLIYLNASRSPELRTKYENFYLSLLSEHRAYLDVLVLDELIYVSRRKYRVPYDVSIEFIESIVLPYVEVLPLAAEELREASEILRSSNVKPSDALHIAVMKLNGITKIASEDRELDKIEGIERIWLT